MFVASKSSSVTLVLRGGVTHVSARGAPGSRKRGAT